LDTHTAVWDWGDGTTSTGTVIESNGSGSVSDSHTYTAAGVYEITLTVTDNNNTSDTEVFQYISVYSPTPQGLFNGVRKFNSPAGAYPANPSLTGQVMFGITAKYQGTTPIGDVSMDFNAANFEFEATGIATLVISNGNKATLSGTGTVNGNSGYTFLVTGFDGGSGGDDYIRFQIKDTSDTIVFDSQPGAGDTVDPTALITAGNVVIH
ncbi:MAG TPA: PKD domain-containing protein, partial [Patescibacteria group bacterium]|nr:PKD domain-containing protein [Patescibacteria group bacterium]